MPAQDSRELSPESRKYVTPIPPAGTKRRPAKKSESVIDLDLQVPKPVPYDVCVDEVESLDPRKDDKPIIKDFTKQWLSKISARWPAPADLRVRKFMHDHNIYNPEAEDIKLIHLVRILRKGTEIEKTGEAKDFNIFKERILERISVLALDMVGKGLLIEVGRTREKNPVFNNVWRNRHSYWGPKDFKLSPESGSPDIYDIESLSDKGSSHKTPTVKMLSKGHQSSPTTQSMGPPPTPARRKLNQSSEGNDQNEHQQKKRKISTMTTRTPALATPLTDRVGHQPSANAVEEALREDPDTRDNLNFAQDFLSSNAHLNPQNPSQNCHKMQSLSKETRPLTPTSPIVTSSSAGDQSFTMPVKAGSEATPDTSPRIPATSPGPGLNNTSPAPQSTNHQPLSMNQRLVLVLEKDDGSLDDDNPLPVTDLRDSNVIEFFALFSAVSKKPLESLDYLTFSFIFAPGNERVIAKGDEAEWNRLKRKALLLFKLYRTRLDETEFQLVVEIGDKKNVLTGMDAIWGV